MHDFCCLFGILRLFYLKIIPFGIIYNILLNFVLDHLNKLPRLHLRQLINWLYDLFLLPTLLILHLLTSYWWPFLQQTPLKNTSVEKVIAPDISIAIFIKWEVFKYAISISVPQRYQIMSLSTTNNHLPIIIFLRFSPINNMAWSIRKYAVTPPMSNGVMSGSVNFLSVRGSFVLGAGSSIG